jgi:transposase
MRNHAGPDRARGAPGAWKQARRVREAAWGNGSADKAGTAPRADFTTHRSQKMRAFTEANSAWLTVVRLPAYAPDLNAVEGAWASMKSSLGNHAATTLGELEAMVRSRLRSIQRRPDLINALLGQTGLSLEPSSP